VGRSGGGGDTRSVGACVQPQVNFQDFIKLPFYRLKSVYLGINRKFKNIEFLEMI